MNDVLQIYTNMTRKGSTSGLIASLLDDLKLIYVDIAPIA